MSPRGIRRLYLWDAATRRITTALTDPAGATGGLASMTYSPDGKTLALAPSDGRTFLWNLKARQITTVVAASGTAPASTSVVFSPDGTTIATAVATAHGKISDNVYLWKLR